MTLFWIISGLLAAAALLFVLPPLLRRAPAGDVSRDAVNAAVYRDQLRELDLDVQNGTISAEHYDKARREIEARVLEDVQDTAGAARTQKGGLGAAAALGLTVPLCALAVYLFVGSPDALLRSEGSSDSAHGLNEQQVLAMIDQLAERMKNNPDDPKGWILLGRSYSRFGRFTEAIEAYRNAEARLPDDDAQLLADYADALAMAHGGRLLGEPEKLIARALKADPDNVKALALAGTVAFEKKDFAGAVRHWERILAVAPPDPEFSKSVRASIAEARSLAGGTVPAQPVARAPATSNGSVSGVVTLAPELATKVKPTDTVFIFARAAEGSRMPIVILRKQVRDLPVSFTLDDTMAMTPEMKLSAHPAVVVGARVSKSSSAAAQPGDLQGLSAAVKMGAAGVNVVIDNELR